MNFYEINQRYLLTNNNLENKDDTVTNLIDKFMRYIDYKSLSIKSPYGTGKTSMLASIFTTYTTKVKRILYVSYRCSLSDDFKKNFPMFSDYRTTTDLQKANMLIIQFESIHKLLERTEHGLCIPTYDLVICDEIESLLSHLQSTTFRGKGKEAFEYL